jgi:hypothetical protein
VNISTTNEKICPDCGAENLAAAKYCWLCRRDMTTVSEVVLAEVVLRRPAWTPSDWFFAILSLLLAIMIVLCAIGLAVEEPSAAIVFGILVVPPLVATIVRVSVRQQRQGHVSWAERFLTFFVSSVIMVGVVGLLLAAAFVAFFVYCLIELNGGWH